MFRCDDCNSELTLKGNYVSGSMYRCPACDTLYFFPDIALTMNNTVRTSTVAGICSI
ncbi:hypothetical protein [Candidatus Magnetomonas plexicatena]|uniref:hypothetical protein n=1 Tax=Candidatus Magnetomonas plexicatena TaxID=2552947 RepID=UPI001C77BD63|nr:hypothetical protein E2O03_014065 [Nitrospirales bacterium LBB_01]